MIKPSQYLKTFLTVFTLGLLFAALPAVASVTSYSNDTRGITCTFRYGNYENHHLQRGYR